ncbi:CDP-diacylglycerol--glycerol-3-phosphate 3-phosphatidyltransferase [Rickettsiales bacterium Ac37b]|nr:CDP-diacylglycerol--glycerol-3-phosphate 3-phosphatidyltransferase [Rickettsiales bacterium Ac37b]
MVNMPLRPLWKRVPNILTASRIIIIPIIVLSFYLNNGALAHRISATLFLFACITDFFDGYLARAWSIQSALGRFLDPIADKLIVGSVILMLVHFDRADIMPALAIICREILVSGLREFLAELRVSMPVSELSKFKTTLQMTAIFLLLLGNEGSSLEYVDLAGKITLWLAAALTIFTGYAYLKASLHYISQNEE